MYHLEKEVYHDSYRTGIERKSGGNVLKIPTLPTSKEFS